MCVRPSYSLGSGIMRHSYGTIVMLSARGGEKTSHDPAFASLRASLRLELGLEHVKPFGGGQTFYYPCLELHELQPPILS